MGHRSLRTFGSFALCAPGLLLTEVHAAGFALIEQSVSAMGSGYAGGAAQAADSTTLFFNPAGMTRLPGARVSGGLHVVIPESSFENDGSSLAAALGGGSLGNNEGGDAGVNGYVPHGYLTYQVSDAAWFGMAINVPYGLSTEYDNGWVGRYHALESELLTVNLNPSFAFKLNNQFSVGLGVSYQYIDAEITNALDLGSLDNVLNPPTAVLEPGSLENDGKIKLKGDDWSWGWNIGLLYAFNEDTRAGLHYRSSIKHTLACCAKYRIPAAALSAPNIAAAADPDRGGLLVDNDVELDVELPASLSASLYHRLAPAWAIMADVTWTDWSSVPELRLEFDNPAQIDGIVTLDWKDSWRYALGVEHTPPGPWTFRGGVALDKTPIPNAKKRTPRIPGEDRLWLTLGIGYKPNSEWQFDLGYAHLFVDDPKIEKTAAPGNEDFLRGSLKGKYSASVDIISAQVEWRFR